MIPSLLPCPLKIRSRAFLPGLVLVLMLLAYPFQEGWCRGEDTAADLKATVTSQEDWFITRADSSSFALVLGGGGVRGFAHIGVLKVLEEEGLHPGLIVGTSMGAVIGALYSCGISAGQLEEMALRQDWLELFSYRRPPPLELQGGWHGLPSAQIALLTRGFPPMPPPSLARGQGVESLLGSLTAGALFAAGNDFDRLPIPFRGVATDLNTGDMVVLSRGSLATAVRASGTVPLLLPPVEWEGRELVDGGFRANNPLVVARAMGFSRALVVDVSNVFVPGKKTPQNLMEMWVRAMELQQYEGNRLDPHQGELILHLPLEDYRSLEFDNAPGIIRIGYQQADAARPALRALMPKEARVAPISSRGPGDVNSPAGAEALSAAPPVVRVEEIECSDARGISPAEICRRLRVAPGMERPPGDFWRLLSPLANAPGVASAGIDLIPLSQAASDRRPPPARLVVHLRLQPQPRWEIAGHVITDDGAAFLARLHQERLPVGGGEAALSARTSHRTTAAGLRLRQEWPPGGILSVQLGAGWSRDRPWLYRVGQPVDRWVIRRSELRVELGLALPAGNLQLRGGVLTGLLNSYLESRTEAGSGDRHLGAFVAELSTGHDRGLVESRRRGLRLSYLRALPEWGDFDLWRLEGGAIGEWKGSGRFRPQAAAGGVFGSAALPVELTGRAGGPLGWLGLRREEIFASRLAWTRAGVAYELSPTFRITVSTAVGWHDDQSLDRSSPLWGGGVGLRWLVPAGPFALYWTVAEHRPATLMIQLGPEF